jgi:hypothetical protein
MPEPPELPPRRADALDVLFWAVVATLGLAIANAGATSDHADASHQQAR